MGAVGNGTAHNNVGLAAEMGEQNLKGSQQGHEMGCAVVTAELFDSRGQFRVKHLINGRAPETADLGAGVVRG